MAPVTRDLKATGIVVAAVAGAAATFFAGATEHLPALVLRTVAGLACIASWPHALGRFPRWSLVAPVFALLVVAASLPTAANPGPAIQAMASSAVVVAVYLTLVATPEDHTLTLLLLAGLTGLLHAGWAVFSWAATGVPRGHGGFFSTNDLAAFLAPLAILAVAQALVPSTAPSSARRLPVGLCAVVLSLGVVATGSRSGLLALGAGLATLAASHARRRVIPAVVGLMLLVVVTPGLRNRWSTAGDAFAFNRIDIWRASVDVALHEPVGVGLGGYASALRRHGVPLDGPVRYPKVATDAHSEPLAALVEMGPAGLIATLLPPILLLAAIMGRWRRRPADGPSTASPPVALATLVAFAIPACVSASLHVPPVALLAAVWAAHVVRQDGGSRPALVLLARPWQRWAAALMLAATLVATVPGAISSVAFERARAARDSGDLNAALGAAELARDFAPWNLGPALLVESLRFASGAPAAEVFEALTDLAARFPSEPQPVDRAAWLLENVRAAGQNETPERARAIVDLRAEVTRRDPRNALAFVALGRAAARAGDEAGAAGAFAAGLEVESRCGECLDFLAQLAGREGRKDEANRLSERARRADELAQSARGRAHDILMRRADSQNAQPIVDYGSP